MMTKKEIKNKNHFYKGDLILHKYEKCPMRIEGIERNRLGVPFYVIRRACTSLAAGGVRQHNVRKELPDILKIQYIKI